MRHHHRARTPFLAAGVAFLLIGLPAAEAANPDPFSTALEFQ